MDTQTRSRIRHTAPSFLAGAASVIAGAIARFTRHMETGLARPRHRIGAWEAYASFRARALREAAQKHGQ